MKSRMANKYRGFTLIELLVVISIIGLLSSIILAGLSSARSKAKESAIISELVQFRTLYELAYSSNNSYASLQSTASPCTQFLGGVGFYCTANTPTKCGDIFGTSGPIPNTTALNLCIQIVANTGTFNIGVATNNAVQKYSMSTYLPAQQKYICMGSSGANSLVTSVSYSPASSGDTAPGCSANP